MKIKNLKGFTLVELLIVIALIGILSVAVLATINPIEQANKARDAKFQNDAAEILSAYERYYASLNTYPWGNPSDVGATIVRSDDPKFGVLDASGEPNGSLITTSELKSSFAGKEPFTSDSAVNLMYVYSNGVDSNYVCYVPKAKANRSKYGDMKCVTTNGLLNPGEGCSVLESDSAGWEDIAIGGNAYFMCVPESTVADVTPGAGGTTEAPVPTEP